MASTTLTSVSVKAKLLSNTSADGNTYVSLSLPKIDVENWAADVSTESDKIIAVVAALAPILIYNVVRVEATEVSSLTAE